MIIRIKNLRLRTFIGINEWEKNTKQDVIINVTMEFDASKAVETDNIEKTVNYKTLTKRIIDEVEQGKCGLLETHAHRVLKLVMENTDIMKATVEIDKLHALRFSDSVSATCSEERKS